jgi:hypothetical protein
MRTLTLTAPSHWASYLINIDSSGLDDDEVRVIHRWLDANDVSFPVSCDDAGFRWFHDASRFFSKGADCQTYTFVEVE